MTGTTLSNGSRWVGRALTALAVLFLTFDASIKLLRLPAAVTATAQLGYPVEAVLVIGAIEAVCLALYLWPRTSLVGAVLWVGYLGGAIATHVRAGSPLITHTLFPLFVAAFLWGGLWLRDAHARRVMRELVRRD
jgi:hypothetical protein